MIGFVTPKSVSSLKEKIVFKRKDSDKFTACMTSASRQMLPKYLLGEQMGWMNSDAEKMLGSHALWMSEVKLE